MVVLTIQRYAKYDMAPGSKQREALTAKALLERCGQKVRSSLSECLTPQ